jgi:site-specific DNA recombinase
MTIKKAAIYLRSSKDRNDVSIDAQRRKLKEAALSRGIIIIQEYSDVVLSGNEKYSSDRKGFLKMVSDMQSKKKEWNCILMNDTSRLIRGRYGAQVFKHDAKKYGVEVIFLNIPDTDPITKIMLEAMFEAWDEVHSITSREKGLAGMSENIEKGFRAGGRAPVGYKLKHIETGAIREGEPVKKSVLEPSGEAPLVKRYLKARAAGKHRTALKRDLKLPWPQSTLIYMEWSALTYAGHTVWNVHNECNGGYTNGTKRRPRSEWQIKRNTHKALITDEESEVILTRLESRPTKRRTEAKYLLTGLLRSPAGAPWHGEGSDKYRLTEGKRQRVSARKIEDAVIARVMKDMDSDAFADQLIEYAKKYNAAYGEDPAAEIRIQEKNLKHRISKLVLMAAQLEDAAPALREIEKLERERKGLDADIKRLEKEYMASQAMGKITREDIKQMLSGLLFELRAMDRETLKDMLNGLIEEVCLDPHTLDCIIRYRVGDKMASPGVYDLIPLKAESAFSLLEAA